MSRTGWTDTISLTRYQIPSVLLMGAGLYLIVFGFILVPHPFQSGYHHSVAPISESEVPESATVRDFESLSPEAKRAFRAALQSPENSVTLWGTKNRAPEFQYDDTLGRYYISYQGDLYELTTTKEGGLLFLPELLLGMFVAAGGLAIAIGTRSLKGDRPRLPLTILVGLLVLWGTFHFDLYSLSANTQLVVSLGLLITILPAAVM